MRIPWPLAAALLAVGLVWPSAIAGPAVAVTETGTVSGTVTGPDGVPMAGVVVCVSGPASAQMWTDLDGHYGAVVAPGEYAIFFSSPDSAVLGEYFDDVRSRRTRLR